MSATSEMLSEIKEVNLSYLLLAQRLLREDKAMGMFRMGISQELADVLANLTLAQTVKLAASRAITWPGSALWRGPIGDGSAAQMVNRSPRCSVNAPG